MNDGNTLRNMQALSSAPQKPVARFQAFGPFNVPVNDSGHLDHSHSARAAFWREVEGREPGLSNACGCFILSILGCEPLPWYVGTAADAPFVAACLSGRVARSFGLAVNEGSHQPIHLHLIARLTPAEHLARPGRRQITEIRFLGRSLVGFCMNRNPHLAHELGASYHSHSSVAGVLQGHRIRPNLDHRALRRVLGL